MNLTSDKLDIKKKKKNKTCTYAAYKRLTSDLETHTD